MKFLVGKEWLEESPSHTARRDLDARRRVWIYCEAFNRPYELPPLKVIAKELGVPQATVLGWLRVIIGYTNGFDSNVERVAAFLESVEWTTWADIQRELDFQCGSSLRAEVADRYPHLTARLRDSRAVANQRRDYSKSRPRARAVIKSEQLDRDRDELENERWEAANLVDFVPPDDEYCETQNARGRGVLCYPRAIWERYRAIWAEKVELEKKQRRSGNEYRSRLQSFNSGRTPTPRRGDRDGEGVY